MINPQMVGSSLSVEDMKRFFVHVVVERGAALLSKAVLPQAMSREDQEWRHGTGC